MIGIDTETEMELPYENWTYFTCMDCIHRWEVDGWVMEKDNTCPNCGSGDISGEWL